MTEIVPRFARHYKIAAVALAIAAGFLCITWTTANRFDGPFDIIFGVAAGIVSAGLFCARICEKERLMRVGVLASLWLWVFVSFASFTVFTIPTSGLLALAWAFLAGGTYWAETAAVAGAS